MRANRPSQRRRGAVIVESAFVLVIFLLLIFGIFEYCRYIFVLQVATNATRDAARYAVVNTDKPASFETTDYTDSSGKTYISIRQYCNNLMSGVDKNISTYAVDVFACDSAKLALSPPQVVDKGTAWNNAAFTEKIAVKITGTYTPFLANFLRMPTSININVVSICGSEG